MAKDRAKPATLTVKRDGERFIISSRVEQHVTLVWMSEERFNELIDAMTALYNRERPEIRMELEP